MRGAWCVVRDSKNMKAKILAVMAWWVVSAATSSQAITFGPFGSKGEGGTKNGQSFTVGAGGSFFELDVFLYLGGLDLNGAQLGTSAQLSHDSLPAGIVFSFSAALSSNAADVVLTYMFSNTTSTVFTNLRFFPFLDAEIDEATNTFFNEYGTTNGTLGLNILDPDRWQIDEPGFQTGTLLRNLLLGALSKSNAVPQTALNDVAMALGFSPGDLYAGESVGA